MNRVILIGNLTRDPERRTTCIADDVQFLGGPRRDNAPGGYDDDYPFPDEE